MTKNNQHQHTIKRLLPYFWPKDQRNLKVRVAFALLCLIAAKLVNVYVPFLYKYAVDALSAKESIIALPVGIILAYGGARALTQFFGELRDFLFINVTQHALREIALSVFKHLHQLSLAFHLERQTGGLSRMIERGTKGLEFILAFMLFNIIPTILELLLVTFILFYKFNIWYALVTFISVVTYIIFTFYVTEWRIKYRKQMNQTENEANTKAIDSLINYETVKYFNNETFEANRFDASLQAYQKAAIVNQSTLSLLNIGQNLIIAVGLIIVMLMAAQGVVKGTLTLGDFVMINTFMIQLYLPLGFLGFVYRQMKQSFVDMDNMFELLDVNIAVKDAKGAKDISVVGATIEFKDVKFSYSSERPILKNLNFLVPAGKTLAIVGGSGAGKSTILRLLYRFYDLSSGEICIDEQDIQQVTQSSLRKAISIVPQDCVLFNDTIAYNIRYGRNDASLEEVIAAAKSAHIHDFIMSLPEGYNAMVGERGLKLSGGEKQRVAIARALLKQPKIMIFDEATSSLDSHTEKAIQASLREISKNTTTVIIAHRLSTIVDADNIIVLEQGKMVEQGRHETLLSNEGAYYAMWQKQQQVLSYEEKLREFQD